MRIGGPQVGQRATRGGGGRGGGASLGWAGTLICRMVSGWRVELACLKPKWRTFMKPSGKTCGRNRRRNSMPSRWAVRRRVLPTFREVKVTGRSWSETIRLLAMATLKTEGARDGKAEWP